MMIYHVLLELGAQAFHRIFIPHRRCPCTHVPLWALYSHTDVLRTQVCQSGFSAFDQTLNPATVRITDNDTLDDFS